MAAHFYGQVLTRAGQTTRDDPVDIFIGTDHLRLPQNMIRFEEQRRTGVAERVDLALTWPELSGYTEALRARFQAAGDEGRLIFLQLSQSTMSRDMSGRIDPIYTRLYEGAPWPGPAGLTAHALKKTAGYGDDILLTGTDVNGRPYAVRCVLLAQAQSASNADCQRDLHVGRDLTLLYRFSSQLLPHWQSIDAALVRFVSARLIPDPAQIDVGNTLRP
ncbi:hypothetical protein [Xaviernesmea oryzae]|uniref:hypothetical protein n=1 Tax=Xaviernesmea oryzae TaxID=464029 RepID=UPI00111341FD|nr:hypothetical protein [Xaviernesmea oryzae]